MMLVSIRGAMAALALTAACGSAHAFSAKGNYDVTFNFTKQGPVSYCVTLASQGAASPYRDTGTATFYTNGAQRAVGSYVVVGKTIAVAVEDLNGMDYLTAAGQFAAGQSFNTAVIDFASNQAGMIYGIGAFQYTRNGAPCAISD